MQHLSRTMFFATPGAIFCTALAVLTMPVPAAVSQDPGRAAFTEAKRVLEEVRNVYATCSSYRDSGKVESLFLLPDQPRRTVIKPFETAFVRDEDRFRFEFRDRAGEYEWNKYNVWQDGDEVHSWWTIKPEVRDWDSLQIALGAAAGVSSRSATIIPSMLLGWPSQYVAGLTDAHIVGSEPVDGVGCVKIEALERRGGPTCTIWVDEKRLVRKVYSVREIAPTGRAAFTVERTITWDPILGAEIPESALGFKPAAPGEDLGPATDVEAGKTETETEPENHEVDPKARQLLLEAREVYATCSSYQDTGQVELVMVHHDRQDTTTVTQFETVLVRDSGSFRFEFRDQSLWGDWRTYAIWSDGADVKSWWATKREVREWESLGAALMEAAGVSSSSSIKVPALLLAPTAVTPIATNDIARMTDARIVASESVEGVECFKITAVEATFFGAQPITIWLDDKRLIRKLYQVQEIDPAKLAELSGASDIGDPGPPFTVRTTITWTPSINEDIPESALGFEPPEK